MLAQGRLHSSSSFLQRAPFVGLGLLLAACSERAATPAPAPTAEQPTSEAPARAGRAGSAAPVTLLEEEAFDSASLGELHGTILFVGQVPERFPLGAVDKPECQHHPGVDQRSNLIIVNDGRLADVYVHLKSGYDAHAIPPAPDAPVRLDQRGCLYVPRTVGLQLGQKLLIANSDPTTHNVNLRAKRNKSSNRSMGASQPELEITFEKPEQRIAVQCDIHSWMAAVVFVEEHPWFAVTDEQGHFRIPDVPPGEYVVAAVHEPLGDAQGSVKVTAGRATGFTLTISK